jgi:hypothetical protein
MWLWWLAQADAGARDSKPIDGFGRVTDACS